MLHLVQCCMVVATIGIAISEAQSPPRIHQGSQNYKQVASVGSSTQLYCPVDGSPQGMFIEWLKDGLYVTSTGEDVRMRVSSSGALKIKDVSFLDAGVYTCRVVNGFGSARANVTLAIIGIPTTNVQSNHHGAGVLMDFISSEKGPPKFTERSSFKKIIQRPAHSSVRFRCNAVGTPTPQVFWMKDGKSFSDSRSSFSRWQFSLQLDDLLEKDSGEYTCIVYNSFGSISSNFSLEVIGVIQEKPDLSGEHPINTTVQRGETAVFQCWVKSKVRPHIKWLRRLDDQDKKRNSTHSYISVNNEFYRVLNVSDVMERPDGSFLNKLHVSDAKPTDAGRYVCWAGNSQGYSYRSAFLNVLSESKAAHRKRDVHMTVIICAVVAVSIFTIIIIALGIHCRHGSPTSHSMASHRRGKKGEDVHCYRQTEQASI